MTNKPTVMISSTVIDLPNYRSHVIDACDRADLSPLGMEKLSALDSDAIEASLEMVNKADVYLGIFAHRYGYIPEGHDISITEMEYERAVEREIPRLIFLIHEDVRVLPKDIDKGDSFIKLEKLKERLSKERVVGFFKSPEHLGELAIQGLVKIKEKLTEKTLVHQEPPVQKLNELVKKFNYNRRLRMSGKSSVAEGDEIANEMREMAPQLFGQLDIATWLDSPNLGKRLAAIKYIDWAQDIDYAEALAAKLLDLESNGDTFQAYHVLLALQSMANQLAFDYQFKIMNLIEKYKPSGTGASEREYVRNRIMEILSQK